MIKKATNIFSRKLYVISDSSDNSITLNAELYKKVNIDKTKSIYLFSFRVGDTFAFLPVDEDFAKTTQCGELQYNSKLNSIGFECLNPSVNYIYYKLGLSDGKHKLRIVEEYLPDNRVFYKILKP